MEAKVSMTGTRRFFHSCAVSLQWMGLLFAAGCLMGSAQAAQDGVAQGQNVTGTPLFVIQRILVNEEVVDGLTLKDDLSTPDDNVFEATLFVQNNSGRRLVLNLVPHFSGAHVPALSSKHRVPLPALPRVTTVRVIFNTPKWVKEAGADETASASARRGLLELRLDRSPSATQVINLAYVPARGPILMRSEIRWIMVLAGGCVLLAAFLAWTSPFASIKVRDADPDANQFGSLTGIAAGFSNVAIVGFTEKFEGEASLVAAALLLALPIVLAPVLYRSLAWGKDSTTFVLVYYLASFLTLAGGFAEAFLLYDLFGTLNLAAVLGDLVSETIVQRAFQAFVAVFGLYAVVTMRSYVLNKDGAGRVVSQSYTINAGGTQYTVQVPRRRFFFL
jgi:hypothetical protein